MIRTLFEDILLPLLFFLLLRSVLGSLLGRRPGGVRATSPPPEAPTVQAGGDLKRDPVCGTYVSTSTSISKSVKGQVVYFCSKECRDKFSG